MEQRIGSSSEPAKAEPPRTEPVTGAGFDPAFIPGITGPMPSQAGPVSKESGEPAEPSGRPGPEAEAEPADGGEVLGEASGESADEASGEAADDGPVFEAADRRARIVADRKGVRLSLDEEACEFRWDEIAAVETETARFGKRFTVTVHTPDRRWFPIEIEAPARARFKEWDERLDAVLDAYFEEA
ncbi:hypothetical protein ABZ760_24310 [Streptomyces sp. NPDC006658]|uniref:hypothetical protein n=1 Tax=Streptomyces sp. NPDC006658 TaxID=3156900 RepID=UPI0034093651